MVIKQAFAAAQLRRTSTTATGRAFGTSFFSAAMALLIAVVSADATLFFLLSSVPTRPVCSGRFARMGGNLCCALRWRKRISPVYFNSVCKQACLYVCQTRLFASGLVAEVEHFRPRLSLVFLLSIGVQWRISGGFDFVRAHVTAAAGHVLKPLAGFAGPGSARLPRTAGPAYGAWPRAQPTAL